MLQQNSIIARQGIDLSLEKIKSTLSEREQKQTVFYFWISRKNSDKNIQEKL